MLILLHELKWKVPVFEAKKLGRHIFVVLLVVGSCVVELPTSAKSVVAIVSCGMATSEQCFFVLVRISDTACCCSLDVCL